VSSEAATGRMSTAGLKRMLGESGTLIALIVLVILLSVTADGFLSTKNLLNIGVQAAVFAILAFGQLFTIISGGIDLSVGSVAALSGMVTAWSATSVGIPALLAVLMGLIGGLLAGLVNGALVAYGKLPAFIATLAMLSIARGLTLVISQGVPIPTPDLVTWLGSDIFGWLPVPLLVMIVMGIIASIILNFTYIGRTIYAIGGNDEAARLSGIRVDRMQLVIYGLSALFAAVAGLLLAGRLASAQPTAAFGYELQAIAAVVIGGASLTGGVGRASGALIGALILAVITNGLNLLQVSSFWQQVVIGVVIALAVLVDTVRRRATR
jgi:ribose transport system substrate-binding protein